MKTEKPKIIIIKDISEMIFKFDAFGNFHKNKAKRGDKNNTIEGKPKIPCKFKGNGNNAAPQIEKGKVNKI